MISLSPAGICYGAKWSHGGGSLFLILALFLSNESTRGKSFVLSQTHTHTLAQEGILSAMKEMYE